MLSIGAAMLGASHVVGVDVDDDALRIARRNAEQYDEPLPVRGVGWWVWRVGCVQGGVTGGAQGADTKVCVQQAFN